MTDTQILDWLDARTCLSPVGSEHIREVTFAFATPLPRGKITLRQAVMAAVRDEPRHPSESRHAS